MSDQLDGLKKLWQDARSYDHSKSKDVSNIIGIAKQKMRSTIRMQLSTIIILFITAIGLAAFFIYVAKFNHTLSHFGVGFMLGGLVLRIIIEFFSIYLSFKINLSDSALKSNFSSLNYFKFRNIVNGPFTIIILCFYTIGFYMLTPEFSLYIPTAMMILIDLSYIIGAIIYTWFIRNAIRKEMNILREVLRIQKDFNDKGSVEINEL